MSFFDDMEKALLEAIEIEKGNIPLKERENISTKSFYIPNNEEKLIDEIVEIRVEQNISQKELAEKVGSKQQNISRLEKKEHSPSLKLFYSVVNALGYDLQIVKRN